MRPGRCHPAGPCCGSGPGRGLPSATAPGCSRGRARCRAPDPGGSGAVRANCVLSHFAGRRACPARTRARGRTTRGHSLARWITGAHRHREPGASRRGSHCGGGCRDRAAACGSPWAPTQKGLHPKSGSDPRAANRTGAVSRKWGPFKRGPAIGPARDHSGPPIEAGPLGPAGAERGPALPPQSAGGGIDGHRPSTSRRTRTRGPGGSGTGTAPEPGGIGSGSARDGQLP